MTSAATTSLRIAGTDHTSVFKELVAAQGETAQQNQQKWQKQRDEALGPIVSHAFMERCKAIGTSAKQSKQGKGQPRLSQREQDCVRLRTADEEWIGEAVKVNRTITSVVAFLRTIRRPYLATTTSVRRNNARLAEANGEKGSFAMWQGVNSLTDKEKDEIEFQVKLTIKRCLARIKELEEGEQVRKRTTASASVNPFSRILGSVASSGTSFVGRSHALYAEQLSQHRFAITQYLSGKLAQANARMGDLQEARLKAQRMKQINLAGSAGPSTSSNGVEQKRAPVAGSVSQGNTDSSLGKGKAQPAQGSDFLLEQEPFQSSFSSAQLTAEQVQQFDEESSALIKSLTEDLAAVEAAERKLSEISELQTQLIQHLGSQAELADNLLQEAVGHTLEVGKGNEQLKRAKENNRQASRFLCLFLIGSGLGLLFLHFVD